MKDGRCPKCGSCAVYCGDGIPLKSGPFGSNSIPVTMTAIAALDNYVCTECGYVERYVADKDRLAQIAARWRPIHPADDPESGVA